MGEFKHKGGSWKIIAAVVAWTGLLIMNACAARNNSAAKQEAKKVTAVEVEKQDQQDLVIISTDSENIPYSVYKWVDPARVVLDVSNATSSGVASTIPVADEIIQEVEVRSLESGEESPSSLVRVIVNLDSDAEYSVERKASKLVIALDKTRAAAKEDVDLFSESQGLVLVEHGDSISIASPEEEWAWQAPQPVGDPPSDQGKARNLVDVNIKSEGDLARVSVMMDGAVGDYSAFTLEKPERLVVDLWGLHNQAGLRRQDVDQQGIARVRAGQHPDKLRLVFDAESKLPNFRFDKEAQRLVVTFSRTMDLRAAPEMSAASDMETAPASAGVPLPPAAGQGTMTRGETVHAGMELAQAEGSTVMEWGLPEEGGTVEWSGPESGAEGGQPEPESFEWTAPEAGATPSPGATPSAPVEWGPPGPAPEAPTPPRPSVTPPVEWPAMPMPEEGEEAEVGVAYIDSVKFEYSNEASSIVIHADRPIRREQWTRQDNQEEKIVSLFISEAQVAADQQRSYDTTEFQSPVELFSVFQRPDQPNEVAIVIVMRNWAASKWNAYDNKLLIKYENFAGSLGITDEPTTGMFGPRGEMLTGGEAMAPGEAPPARAPEERREVEGKYTGALISLDFKNLPILDALRTIAEVSGMNMIVSEDVSGTLTMKLDNVPWDQALDLILDTKSLGKVMEGNVMRIATKDQLQKEKAQRMAEREAERKFEDLATKIIPINYMKASDMQRVVKPILTEGRGEVDAHRATNSIIIRDIPKVIQEASALIGKLDRPTKQVLIEARIVESTVSVTREIGVQWGTNMEVGPSTGYPTGLNFPNNIQVGGAVLGGTGGAAGASGLSGGGGAIGMSVGSLTNVLDLDVALRALESQEKLKIISSPRVLTLTDEQAIIQQGISIPYPPPSVIGGAAVGWTFVDATLQLRVTPHVSEDGSIIMEVQAQNNEPISVAGSQQPGVSRKETRTTILIKNGETAVIGGIFKTRKDQPKTQVPFLGNLPFIGWMFSDRINASRNEELIIFLTPQIIGEGAELGKMTGESASSGM